MIWETLGISPTKDIKEIKKAYTALAKQFNPEEHPEEFRRIFDAYKAACRYAKTEVYYVPHEQAVQEAEIVYEAECPFDFSAVNHEEEAAKAYSGTQLKAHLLNTIKSYIADSEKKNNCELWKKFFSSEEFEQFYFESDFRNKAADIIFCETFTPQAASVIASGFGRGTKAIPLKSDPLNQWQVEISNCEGRPSPQVAPLNSPRFIYRDMTLRDLIICIMAITVLIFIAAAYSSWHTDQVYMTPTPSETTVNNEEPPYIYTDELGNLHIDDSALPV